MKIGNEKMIHYSGRMSSQDDLDDDTSSVYTPSTSGAAGKPEMDIYEHQD